MDVNSTDNLPATGAQAPTRPQLIRRNAKRSAKSIFANGNIPRQHSIILSPIWPSRPSTIWAVDPIAIFPKRAVLPELNIPWFEVELLPCGSLEFNEWVSDLIWDRMLTEHGSRHCSELGGIRRNK
jgi:hypothetical protein